MSVETNNNLHQVAPIIPLNLQQIPESLHFPESETVINNAKIEIKNLKADMTFEDFKKTLEWLKNLEWWKKQILLWSLLSVLNAKWYSIKLIQDWWVEVFWENMQVFSNEDKQELLKYDILLKSALKQNIFDIYDIQKAILSKSMSVNSFQNFFVSGEKMTTTDYFMTVLKKYWLKLNVDTEKWLQESDIWEYLKKLNFADYKEFERFKNSQLHNITDISDREFVRAYLDSLYYLNWENWYEEEDIQKLQTQVDENKNQIDQLFLNLPEQIQVKLWMQKESIKDRISRDPMWALQEWAMNWWIMYAVIFWLLGKVFGWIFWIKHSWKLWILVWWLLWSWQALWWDMKDLWEISKKIWESEMPDWLSNWASNVFDWSKELYWEAISNTNEFIDKLKLWYEFKDVKIGDLSIINYNFFNLGDKISSSKWEIYDWKQKIWEDRLWKLKDLYISYKDELLKKTWKNIEDLQYSEPYKNFDLRDVIKYVNTNQTLNTSQNPQTSQNQTIDKPIKTLNEAKKEFLEWIKWDISKDTIQQIKNIYWELELDIFIQTPNILKTINSPFYEDNKDSLYIIMEELTKNKEIFKWQKFNILFNN